jgi:hypothetical protein
MQRVESICLSCSRCAAALINPADRALFTQDYRTTGERLLVLGVPDTDARDVGDGVV